MKHIITLIAIVISSLFILTGCGSKNNAAPSNSPSATAGDNMTNKAENGVKGAVDDTGNAVKDAAEGAGSAAGDIMDGAGNVVEDAGNAVGNATKDMGNAVKDATQ